MRNSIFDYGTVNGMWNLHFLKVKNAESNKNEFLSRPVSRENWIWKWIPNPFWRSQKSVRKGEETVPTRLKRFYTNIYSSRRILKIWPEVGRKLEFLKAFSILNTLKTKRKSWFDFPHALKPFNFLDRITSRWRMSEFLWWNLFGGDSGYKLATIVTKGW